MGAGAKARENHFSMCFVCVLLHIIVEMWTRGIIEKTQNYLLQIRNKEVPPYFKSELGPLFKSQVIERNS